MYEEHVGSVVECLTRDQEDVGLRVSPEALCCVLKQDTSFSAYYWFNPGRPVPT